MKPLYRTEDWARQFLGRRLGVKMKGRRKTQHWHDIVRRFVLDMDHYEAILAQLERER